VRGAAQFETVRRPERIRGAEGQRCAAGAVHVEPPRVLGAAVVPHCMGEIVSHPHEHRQRVGPRWALLGRLGHRWTRAGACVPPGKRGRPARSIRGVLCGVTHGAHGDQERRAWTLGKIRRIQADPDGSRRIQTNSACHAGARTSTRQARRGGAREHAQARDVAPPAGVPVLTLARSVLRQGGREAAHAPECTERPGVTTSGAWSDDRRSSRCRHLSTNRGARMRHTRRGSPPGIRPCSSPTRPKRHAQQPKNHPGQQ